MNGRFHNRVAIVTGAAAGMGRAITDRLLLEGAHVIACDLDSEGLSSLAGDQTRGVTTVHADVSTPAGANMIVAAAGRFEHVDILVNNAGIYPNAPIEDISFEEWQRIIAVNLGSVFLVSQAILPFMKARQYGRIINLGSSSFFAGPGNSTHYVASKGGVIGFSRSLAGELGAHGITVNVVTPGVTLTDTILSQGNEEILEMRRKQRPIPRHQEAIDVVGAILFLASDDASFITGQVINVDGGIIKH